MVRLVNIILVMHLILHFSSSGLAETILCSVCTSDTDPDCESEPPSPSPCRETVENAACKVVREKNYAGQTIKFARACSTISKDMKTTIGCLPMNNQNITVCYEICFEDGCNMATKFSTSIGILISAVVFYFVL